MSSVSHRDANEDQSLGVTSLTGAGSPEGVVAAAVGSIYRRTDGGADTTLYIKETGAATATGWQPVESTTVDLTALTTRVTTAENDITALEAADVALDGRLGTAESDINALETADTTLDGRLDAVEANNWVTTARILDANVTLAKMANMATASFIGRNTALTGVPEVLSAATALGILPDATATVRGIVPTPPNNTTTFLRGDATFAAPKQRMFLWYAGAVMTAGDQNKYGNTVGYSTSPIGATPFFYTSPVTGTLVAIQYQASTAHSTNTVTITPRVTGVEETGATMTITATTLYQRDTVSLAIEQGDYIACQMDHNGATNLANFMVCFEIEY